MGKREPKNLYHYCSLSTFMNIISKKSIWLSDVGKSNDSQELNWLKNKYEKFLSEQWVSYAKQKLEKDELFSVDFEAFDSTHEFTNWCLKNIPIYSFVFCLSEHADDLGQWRGYADDGCGVSIGFNKKFFQILRGKYLDDRKDFNFNFQKVLYGDKAADELFSGFSDSLNIGGEMSSEEVLRKLEVLCTIVMELAPTVKNEGFKSEKEWRIVYNVNGNSIKNGLLPDLPACLSDYSNLIQINGLHYTAKENQLVGHIEMGLPCLDNLISEIVIGPKCAASKDDIMMFLISEGLVANEEKCKIKIRKSTSSYR